jgi:hypothetical protein
MRTMLNKTENVQIGNANKKHEMIHKAKHSARKMFWNWQMYGTTTEKKTETHSENIAIACGEHAGQIK